jgi:hypothetical protein
MPACRRHDHQPDTQDPLSNRGAAGWGTAGDAKRADFFRRAQAESREGGEQGEQLLRKRLGTNVAIFRVSGPSAVAGQPPGVSSRLVPPVHGSDRPVSVGRLSHVPRKSSRVAKVVWVFQPPPNRS